MTAASFAAWVVRHARSLVLGWLVVGVLAALVAPHTLARLEKGSGEIAGSEAVRLDRTLRAHFETPLANRLVLVVETPHRALDAPELRPWLDQAATRLRAVPAVQAVEGPFHRGDLVGGEPGSHHRTWVIALRDAQSGDLYAAVGQLRAALAPVREGLRGLDPGAVVALTGGVAVGEDIGQRCKQDGQWAEAVAMPLTLAALGLAFRAVGAAALPLVCAAFAIVFTFAAGYPVTAVTPLSNLMENVVSMLGLAVGIDYALLLVERWRHERREAEGAEAVLRATTHAAPAIAISGLAVACGMGALALPPLLELQSLAFGGVVVVLCSIAAATTLLPALLVCLGRWVEWPARPGGTPAAPPAARRWERLATAVTARPGRALAAGGLLLALLIAPAFTLRTGAPPMRDFPPDMESAQGVAALVRMDVGQQTFDVPILVETTDGSPVLDRRHLGALHRFTRTLEADPRVLRVVGPLSPRPAMSRTAVAILWHDWRATLSRHPDLGRLFVSRDGQRLLMTVVPHQGVLAQDVQRLAREIHALGPGGPLRLTVGGQPTDLNALDDRLARDTNLVLATVAALTGGLLGLAFRSFLVPLKAIGLNLLSVGAGFGVITAVCQWGWGARLIGLAEPLAVVPPFLPLLLFCCVFGLSMDYEVFMISRIRERLLVHGDQRRAIVEGLTATGPVITHAASVMVIVFGAFALADILVVKVLGLGLATAVLVDALVVRTLLAGPLLLLAGRWNWYPGMGAGPAAETAPTRPAATLPPSGGEGS